MKKFLLLSCLVLAGCGQVQYVASKNSQVFHKSTCGDAAHIKAENLVQLGVDRKVAASGHRPCDICKP